MASRPERYLFQHVPKTAGTSLWVAFVALFGRDQVSAPVGPDELMTDEQAAALRRHRVVSGHICRRDVDRHFPDWPVLTILRHPLDREVSSYYFHRAQSTANTASAMSIEEYFDRTHNEDGQREIWNRQVRQLGGNVHDAELDLDEALRQAKELLQRCVWIGIHDQLETDYQRLRDMPEFGGLPSLPRERVTEARPRCAELPKYLRDKIVAKHQYDMELYQWALELNRAQPAPSRRSPAAAPAGTPQSGTVAGVAPPIVIAPQSLIDRATALEVRGDLSGAKALLLAAVDADPRLVWHHRRMLQETLTRADGNAELVEVLDRALADFPQLNYAADPHDGTAFIHSMEARAEAIYNDKPSMLLAFMPRTARDSMSYELVSGMGMMPGLVTPQFAPKDDLVPSWVRDFARGGMLAGTRLDGRPENLKILHDSGIRKIVVHVRDPRQAIVSSLYHNQVQPDELPDLRAYLGVNWECDIDYSLSFLEQVDAYANLGALPNGPLHWLASWIEAAGNDGYGVEIMFTQFDDFVHDRRRLYENIVGFFGIDPARFHFDYVGTAVPATTVKSPDWRDVLGPGQIERLNALIPRSWFDRFGWPRDAATPPANLVPLRARRTSGQGAAGNRRIAQIG